MLRWDQDEYGHEEGRGGLGLQRTLIIVFAAWAMHAIANLVISCTRLECLLKCSSANGGALGKGVS